MTLQQLYELRRALDESEAALMALSTRNTSGLSIPDRVALDLKYEAARRARSDNEATYQRALAAYGAEVIK